MKIGGKSLVSKNYVYVTLKKGDLTKKESADTYRLKVCSLPAGWQIKYQDTGLFQFPKVPTKVRKEENGRIIKGDKGKMEYFEDRDDPKYRKEFSQVLRRVTALRVRAVLSDDESVEFGVTEPDLDANKEVWRTYADELADEIEAALTTEEIDKIIEASDEAEVVYEIEKAIDSF